MKINSGINVYNSLLALQYQYNTAIMEFEIKL